MVWKVVDKITDDDFKDIRKFEDTKFEEIIYSPMKEPAILKDLNYAKGYWYLWPTNVDDSVAKIHIAITKEDISRKERHQRPIHAIGKSDYIMLTALMIDAAVHSDKGKKLWNAVYDKKKKKGLSKSTDHGKYMKLWRFKEIKHVYPR